MDLDIVFCIRYHSSHRMVYYLGVGSQWRPDASFADQRADLTRRRHLSPQSARQRRHMVLVGLAKGLETELAIMQYSCERDEWFVLEDVACSGTLLAKPWLCKLSANFTNRVDEDHADPSQFRLIIEHSQS
ncbi:hypothetical protein DOTSEDRAFT_34032 [Dothistroma septosporum NZE10]|uniref:Uncharacterized protein n=1 Tax=Dothistroma septosporum (strain NZE10 / CBS 128990) TaxID=675120 RepID=N1PT42_DOTSN|nr:hypothetical protein DOTSEDRAFT_34032 [Dothistroma septosporum NZE10]